MSRTVLLLLVLASLAGCKEANFGLTTALDRAPGAAGGGGERGDVFVGVYR